MAIKWSVIPVSDALQEAYEETGYDVVETGAGVEVPTSTAAYFEYSDDGCVTYVSDARAAIEAGDYALIAPATEEGEGDKFYLSSKILASGTNEFLHVKMNSAGVRVFPKDDDFSFETLEALVEHLESELGTSLTFVPSDDEDD